MGSIFEGFLWFSTGEEGALPCGGVIFFLCVCSGVARGGVGFVVAVVSLEWKMWFDRRFVFLLGLCSEFSDRSEAVCKTIGNEGDRSDSCVYIFLDVKRSKGFNLEFCRVPSLEMEAFDVPEVKVVDEDGAKSEVDWTDAETVGLVAAESVFAGEARGGVGGILITRVILNLPAEVVSGGDLRADNTGEAVTVIRFVTVRENTAVVERVVKRCVGHTDVDVVGEKTLGDCSLTRLRRVAVPFRNRNLNRDGKDARKRIILHLYRPQACLGAGLSLEDTHRCLRKGHSNVYSRASDIARSHWKIRNLRRIRYVCTSISKVTQIKSYPEQKTSHPVSTHIPPLSPSPQTYTKTFTEARREKGEKQTYRCNHSPIQPCSPPHHRFPPHPSASHT